MPTETRSARCATQRAFRERSLGLVYVAVHPDFAIVRNHRRVMAILAAVKLPPASQ